MPPKLSDWQLTSLAAKQKASRAMKTGAMRAEVVKYFASDHASIEGSFHKRNYEPFNASGLTKGPVDVWVFCRRKHTWVKDKAMAQWLSNTINGERHTLVALEGRSKPVNVNYLVLDKRKPNAESSPDDTQSTFQVSQQTRGVLERQYATRDRNRVKAKARMQHQRQVAGKKQQKKKKKVQKKPLNHP
jgi:hypothetical protein